MQKIKHEIRDPWKGQLKAAMDQIARLDQEILVHQGNIYACQAQQHTLRSHARFLVGGLVQEAQLPNAGEGAYQLSADGCFLEATTADAPQPDKE